MAGAIRYRNDEQDCTRNSYWIYKSIEDSLAKLARERGQDVSGGYTLETSAPRAVAYASSERVVSIGLTAHERLAPLIRSSLIYLEGRAGDDSPEVDRLTRSAAVRNVERMVLLGAQARRSASFLPFDGAHHYELPPIDLSALPATDAPRLMIVNHLADETLARGIARRFLDGSAFALDCVGLDGICLEGEGRNRVRCLDDAAVGDAQACVHVHVGAHGSDGAGDGDRLRIVDSWWSRVPVLFFDVDEAAGRPGAPERRRIEVRNEHDVLVCRSYAEACDFLAMILETPALRRLMTENGRGSASPGAQAWTAIAQDLAA